MVIFSCFSRIFANCQFFMTEDKIEAAEPRKLYPYQEQAVTNIFNRLLELPPNANLLFQLPTGGGKTIIFSEMDKAGKWALQNAIEYHLN